MPEQGQPSQVEADCPKVRVGTISGTTIPAADADQAACLAPADIPTIPLAKVAPTSLHLTFPIDPLESSAGPPHTGTARTA